MATHDEQKPSDDAPASDAEAPVVVATTEPRWRRILLVPPRLARRVWRRTRLRVLLVRVVVYGFIAVVLLLFAGYGAIKVLVKPDDLRRIIKEQVEEQTGGRLDLAAVRFDILTGVRLEGVQFYPPKAGDTRGFAHGGEVDPIALANFDALDVRYSIPRIIAGRVVVKALQLVEPQFHLRQTDGVFNFESILAYRAVRFPSEPEPEAKKEEPAAKKEPGEGLLPFSPALLYMPLEIMAQNIGIKNLRLDMIKEEKGQLAQILSTSGLTVDLGLSWFGTKSSMWTVVTSPFEQPLEVDIKDAKRGEDGAPTGELQQTLSVKTALYTRVALDDFKKVGLDFGLRVLDLKTPLAGYQDLGAYTKIRLKAADDYLGVSFDTFEADLADAVTFDMSGAVKTPSAAFEVVDLKLKQKVGLDLKAAARLAKPFVPDLKADGAINVEDLKIDGALELAKLGEAGRSLPLPYVTGVVWLEDVWADYPGTGVTMEPISGDISIAAGPALGSAGSQVDTSVDLVIPALTATQKTPVGEITAGVDNLSVKLTARALWPEMVAPILKLNVEADHVTSSGKGLSKIDVPLYVDVDADGRQDLQRLGLTANVELGDLAEISAMADCQSRCAHFRSNSVVRLASLEKLHRVALPLGGVLGLGDFMPTKLKGTVDLQVAARGKLPDPLATPVPDLVKGADVRFNTQFHVGKVSAQVPFMKVDLKDFETRLLASGSLAEQTVDLQTRFESLRVVPPGMERPVSLERFEFSTEAQNTVDGPLDIADPKALMSRLKSTVFTKLNLGHVAAEGLLPRPMGDTRVTMLVQQERMQDFKLDELRVKLPDYGVSTAVFVDTRVGPDFMPQRLKTRVAVNVAHNGGEQLPGGVKTSGNVDVRVAVQSDDMKTATVEGETSFDKFNVTIPAADGQGPAVLTVEEISGQIPFKQQVALPELRPANPDPAFKDGKLVAQDGAGEGADAGKDADKGAAPSSAALAAVPVVDVVDDADEAPPKGDAKLRSAMDKYFEKNDDKILASTNVVALVDYPTIRPFYPDKRPLSIKRLEAANLELSKMEFDVELRQNWFAVNQFMIDFLGGKIQGDFQLAFDAAQKAPKDIPRSLRTSVHLTRLDTRKLIERFPNLKGKESSGFDLFSNPYIDGTVHLNYDFKSNDMSGGVDITSIGKDQLRMMLYYVDPYEQNPTITSLRGKLALGDVRKVTIPLKNGEIGMDVDVRLLSAPLPVPKLQRIPVSQIVQNVKDKLIKGGETPADDAAQDASAAPAGDATPAPGT